MTERTELPWYTSQGKHEDFLYSEHPCYIVETDQEHIAFCYEKPYAESIVRACNRDNAFEDLLEACENAVKQMGDDPVQAGGEWEQGLFCGLEDMDITDRYAACRHGYDKALEKVQEWIIDEIEAAIEKAENKP